MTKIATPSGSASKPVPAMKKGNAPAKEKPKESFRDIAEQIVVAVLLAILIRGFDAEAFVIPTGSMAPTLKGRHKEVSCPQCGELFSVNSSEDSEAFFRTHPRERSREFGLCVNCRFPVPLGSEPSFKGDRILVMKFPYEFPGLPGSGGPDRWDVVVFHYPEKPEINYIKRLVGMPNEDLRVHRGNLYVREANSTEPFHIARKPLSRQRAMSILVNDDNHRATLLKDRPEWLRWQGTGGATETKTPGVFTLSGASGRLQYRQLVPDPEQWDAIARNTTPETAPRATLITDFYSYNASSVADSTDELAAWLQSDWVGDLSVEFAMKVEKPEGEVRFELVESGIKNRCVVDLKTGTATLYHGDVKLGEAATSISAAGRYSIGFANVDDRLSLWVDGRTPFGDGLPYNDPPSTPSGPTAADLVPVEIATAGASVEVSGLVLKRDIYYTLYPSRPDCPIPSPPVRFGQGREPRFARVVQQFDFLSDPAKFMPLLAELEPGDTYTIKPDHFMMMGDNSPRSSDSRAWGRGDRDWDPANRSRWEVPRTMLIGKAFFVYWPHGVPFWPKFQIARDFLVPFRPNFERMRPIR
jgi:signal peptidase I